MFRADGAFIWECHSCGWSLTNTNDKRNCDECGAQIRCSEAGGHHDFDGDRFCDNGCGYNFSTGLTDLSKRRENY